jgi:hypothetical protein
VTWAKVYNQAMERPSAATQMLLEQATLKLADVLTRGEAYSGPASERASSQPGPAVRPELAGNQTYRALLAKGVHPSHAATAIDGRNVQLVMTMLNRPEAYASPGAAALRALEHAGEVGGLG